MLLLLLLLLLDASIIHTALGLLVVVSPPTVPISTPVRSVHRLRFRTFRSQDDGHDVDDDDEVVDDRDGTRRRRIHDLIHRMSEFYVDMVDTNDHCRFYATCVPSTGMHSHYDDDNDAKKKNIIRDLAAAWDASKLLLFYQDHSYDSGDDRQEDMVRLRRAMANTVEHYQAALVPIVATTTTMATRPAASNIMAGLRLSSDQLQQASSIGHSALMILAAIGWCKVLQQQSSSSSEPTTTNIIIMELSKIIEGLAWGILSQQRDDDGAFRIVFDRHDENDEDETNVYQGIEFYPGEAMVALAEVYDYWPMLQQHPPEHLGESAAATSIQTAIRQALPRALRFYSDYFYRHGTAVNANYSIWQIQAAARLFRLSKKECWNQPSLPQIPTTITTTDRPRSDADDDDLSKQGQLMTLDDVATYVMDLCETIVTSNAWRHHLARGPSFYANLQTIEISCGLDAIGDAMGIIIRIVVDAEAKAAAAAATHHGAAESVDGRSPERIKTVLRQRIDDAVFFFEWTLANVPAQAPVGHGGLGMGGTVVREQRLDVTGHAVSALIKLYSLYTTLTSSSTNANAP
jgi:hypothetical protein